MYMTRSEMVIRVSYTSRAHHTLLRRRQHYKVVGNKKKKVMQQDINKLTKPGNQPMIASNQRPTTYV